MRRKTINNRTKTSGFGKVSQLKKIFGAYAVWMTLAVLAAVSVYFTIEMATSGAEVARMEKREIALVKENRTLSDSIVKLSSLNQIEQKAQEMGFNSPQQVLYLGQEDPVAKLP